MINLLSEQGKESWFETFKSPIFNNRDEVTGTAGFARDISERKHYELELKQAATVFENTAEGVVITDRNAIIIKANNAFSTITGYPLNELLGQPMNLIQSGKHSKEFYVGMWTSLIQDGKWQGEIWNRSKDGSIYPQWLSINALYDDDNEIINYVGVMLDISHLKDSEMKLDFLANHDSLTGLANRRCMADRLQTMISNSRRHNKFVGILFLDLDRFKSVNDSLGHHVGDKILIETGHRLKTLVRNNDLISRLGGDEFVILLDEIASVYDIHAIAKKILSKINEPFIFDDFSQIHLSASIGATLYPVNGDSVDQLIKNADTAMYKAKDSGRNQVQFYSVELSQQAEQRFFIENGIRRAMENSEFCLYYQPQIDIDTPAIREALMKRIDDSDCNTKCEAILGLARRKDKRVFPVIRQELMKPNPTSLIFEAAEEFGDKSLLPLIEKQILSIDGQTSDMWLTDVKYARDKLSSIS